jgi:hypothetical protein
MTVLREFSGQLERLADYLVFRFKSTESATAIREYLEGIGDIVTPADARDILGEILESKRGAIKPPHLEALLRAAMQSLFNAMDEGDGLRWPGELMLARAMAARMFDPYTAIHLDMRTIKLPSGEVAMWIEIGPEVAVALPPGPRQSPAAIHSNSVARVSSPAISRRVTASPSGKVKQTIGAAAMTA